MFSDAKVQLSEPVFCRLFACTAAPGVKTSTLSPVAALQEIISDDVALAGADMWPVCEGLHRPLTATSRAVTLEFVDAVLAEPHCDARAEVLLAAARVSSQALAESGADKNTRFLLAGLAAAVACEAHVKAFVAQHTSAASESGLGLASDVFNELEALAAAGDSERLRRVAALLQLVCGKPAGLHLRNLLWHGFLPNGTGLGYLACALMVTTYALVRAELSVAPTVPAAAEEAVLAVVAVPAWVRTSIRQPGADAAWRAAVPRAWHAGLLASIRVLAADPRSGTTCGALMIAFPLLESALRCALADNLGAAGYSENDAGMVGVACDGQQFYTFAQLLAEHVPHWSTLRTDAAADGAEALDGVSLPRPGDGMAAACAAWWALLQQPAPLGPCLRDNIAHARLHDVSSAAFEATAAVALRLLEATVDGFQVGDAAPAPALCTFADVQWQLSAHVAESLVMLRAPGRSQAPLPDGEALQGFLTSTGYVKAATKAAAEPASIVELRAAWGKGQCVPVAVVERLLAAASNNNTDVAPVPATQWPDKRRLAAAAAFVSFIDAVVAALQAHSAEIASIEALVAARQARTAHRTKLNVLLAATPLLQAAACVAVAACAQLLDHREPKAVTVAAQKLQSAAQGAPAAALPPMLALL